jgi:hypothetical protein
MVQLPWLRLVLLACTLLVVVANTEQRPDAFRSGEIRRSIETLLSLPESELDALLEESAASSDHFAVLAEARLLRERRELATNSSCRAVVLNKTEDSGAASVVEKTAQQLQIDYVEMMLGITAGPLILLYGTDLKAFLVLLNAMYATDFFGFLRELQSINCFMELDTKFPNNGFKVIFGISTIATVGLKGGAVELILNVGIVSGKLSAVGYDLISQVELDEYWTGIVYGGMTSFVSGLACTLSAGIAPYGLGAGFVTFVSTGALAGEVVKAARHIEKYDIACEPRTLLVKGPDGTDVEVTEQVDACGENNVFKYCQMVAWGNVFMQIIPVFVAVLLALIAKRFPCKILLTILTCRCLGWLPCFKSKHEMKHTMLDIAVPAIMGASLLTTALQQFIIAFADMPPEDKALVLAQVGLPAQSALSLLSLWIQYALVQEQAKPCCLIAWLARIKGYVLWPLQCVNDFLFTALGGEKDPSKKVSICIEGAKQRSSLLVVLKERSSLLVVVGSASPSHLLLVSFSTPSQLLHRR